jgi:anti-sigma factor RsiW
MNEIEHDVFRQWIRRAGGPALDPREAQRLNAHLVECPACRSEAEELTHLDAALRRAFHVRWDRVPEPSRSTRKSLDLAPGLSGNFRDAPPSVGVDLRVDPDLRVDSGRTRRCAPTTEIYEDPGIRLKRIWQTASTVVGIILLVILLVVGALLTSKALPAQQPLPRPLVSTRTVAPELPSTPIPTQKADPGSVRLAEATCARAEPLPDLPELERSSGKALAGSGLVQSGDFKIGLWLACDPSFAPLVNDLEKDSELAGLGIYYTWIYSGPEQKGTTVFYAGFEPSFKQIGSSGPSLRSTTTLMGSRGFAFPSEYAPDWSQERVTLRFIVKIQPPDGHLQGADLRFDLVGSAQGVTVQNLMVAALPLEALSNVGAGIAQKPAYVIRQPETLDPLLSEMDALIQKWSQEMKKGPGWVHLLTKNETASPGTMPDGSPAPVWTQSDAWYLLDENYHQINAINRILDPSGNAIQAVVLRNGFWDNLTYNSHDPDDPTKIFTWDSGIVKQFSAGVKKGGKLAKSLSQTPEGQHKLIFQLIDLEINQTVVFDAQTGQQLEWTIERLTAGTPANGSYKIAQRLTNLLQERVSAPPDAILALLGQAAKPFQPAASQGTGTPAPAGYNPARGMLSMKMVMGDDLNAPTFWYGDLSADGYWLGRVNFGATPGGWCDRSPDGSKITFSFDVQNSETALTSTLRWLDLQDVTRVYDPIPQFHLVSPITWGPDNRRVAFSGGTNDQDRALFVYDIQSQELHPVGKASLGPLLWSPDGQWLAQLEENGSGSSELAVYRVADGTEIYRGPWDRNVWQPSAGAPILTWGVQMPRNTAGFERCVNP